MAKAMVHPIKLNLDFATFICILIY